VLHRLILSTCTDEQIQAILLVGGFGTNRYMHQQLNVAYKKTGIKVLQTNGGYVGTFHKALGLS
jgi:hydrogenase maturation factor HypF (carbamoyltransferase family)